MNKGCGERAHDVVVRLREEDTEDMAGQEQMIGCGNHTLRSELNTFLCYLTGEHGTKVVTAGSQDNPMSRKIRVLHPQRNVTECVALTERVHGVENGLGMGIGHDVFGSHDAFRMTRPQTTQGVCNTKSS